MRARSLFLSVVLAFFCRGVFPSEITTQDLGLPSPVEFEAVFPQVAFGKHGPFQLETEFVIINPTDHEARVYIDLFEPDGQFPAVMAEDRARGQSRLSFSDADQRFHTYVHAHFVRRIYLPGRSLREGETAVLAEDPHLLWARMQSNQPLMVIQRIEITHRDSGTSSELTFMGNYQGALEGEIRVQAFKSDVYNADPVLEGGVQIGWSTKTTGIALVNPLLETNEIRLELLDEVVSVSLAPSEQKSFLIWELFPSFHPASTRGLERLKLLSVTGLPFSVIALSQQVYAEFSGKLILTGGGAPVRITRPSAFRIPKTREYDFPVPVLEQLTVEDLQVVVTRFAFYVLTTGGDLLGLHKSVGRDVGKGVVADAEAGIAVAYGYGWSAIIFIKSKKMLWLDTGGRPEIEDLPESNQIWVRSGVCFYDIILIDKTTEEIISKESGYDCGFLRGPAESEGLN